MSLLVKICGLRNAADVDAAVTAGADAVGFVFAESVRRVMPAEARDAAVGLSQEVRRVAVMRHPENEEWLAVLNTFAPDVLQTDIDDFEALDVPHQIERWPVIRENHPAIDQSLPDTFLYEGSNSGLGQTVDWERAAVIAGRGNMILAGGLSAENVAEAIRAVHPRGVDVSSAVESAPGQKDPDLIRNFISAARAAENNA